MHVVTIDVCMMWSNLNIPGGHGVEGFNDTHFFSNDTYCDILLALRYVSRYVLYHKMQIKQEFGKWSTTNGYNNFDVSCASCTCRHDSTNKVAYDIGENMWGKKNRFK